MCKDTDSLPIKLHSFDSEVADEEVGTSAEERGADPVAVAEVVASPGAVAAAVEVESSGAVVAGPSLWPMDGTERGGQCALDGMLYGLLHLLL